MIKYIHPHFTVIMSNSIATMPKCLYSSLVHLQLTTYSLAEHLELYTTNTIAGGHHEGAGEGVKGLAHLGLVHGLAATSGTVRYP